MIDEGVRPSAMKPITDRPPPPPPPTDSAETQPRFEIQRSYSDAADTQPRYDTQRSFPV